jgi:hypothetical protein
MNIRSRPAEEIDNEIVYPVRTPSNLLNSDAMLLKNTTTTNAIFFLRPCNHGKHFDNLCNCQRFFGINNYWLTTLYFFLNGNQPLQ